MAGLIRGTKVDMLALCQIFRAVQSLNWWCRTGRIKAIAGRKRCLDIERSAHIDKRKIQCRVFRNASLENADIVEYAPCQALCSRQETSRWCRNYFKKNLILKEGDILGFVDESSQNTNSNTERLWSFKELKMKKITAHVRAKLRRLLYA